MDKIERALSLLACLALPANLAAQSVTEQQDQVPAQHGQAPEQSSPESRPAPAPRAVPHITGTVLRWNGYRIDLKTPEGETQVAVNEDTERLVEIEPGAEVTVEYLRKIGDFVIAERVRQVEEAGTAAESGTGTAPDASPSTMTGTILSWTEAALVLRTDEGDVTLFLSPRTESLVKTVEPGLPVTVEYEETSNGSKLATRVQAAKDDPSQEPETGE